MDKYIDMELLSNFMTVVKTMNITSAASMLYVSQPTLSRQIQILEKQLGVSLFIHSKKALQLTPAGQLLYLEGQELLSIADNMISRVHAVAAVEDCRLIIETSLFEHRRLRENYARFREQNPMVSCTVISRRPHLILDDIIAGNADIGLITAATAEEVSNKMDKMEFLQIGMDRLAVLVNKNHHFAKKGSCTFDDLRNEADDILYSTSAGGFSSGGNYKFFQRIANQENLKISEIKGTTWETLLYDLAFQNRVVICLKSFEDDCGPDYRVVEIKDSQYPCEQYLIWSKGSDKSNAHAILRRKFLNLFI